jgi:hypothetical protein
MDILHGNVSFLVCLCSCAEIKEWEEKEKEESRPPRVREVQERPAADAQAWQARWRSRPGRAQWRARRSPGAWRAAGQRGKAAQAGPSRLDFSQQRKFRGDSSMSRKPSRGKANSSRFLVVCEEFLRYFSEIFSTYNLDD